MSTSDVDIEENVIESMLQLQYGQNPERKVEHNSDLILL